MTRLLLAEFPIIKFSVSATTRAPRKNETNGVEYHFITPEEFEGKIKEDQFLEWEEFYNGTRYGTLKADVESKLDKGYFIMLDLDVLGALNVKNMYGDEALSIFISPPSLDILEERLRKRGTENNRSLKVRLERAKKEIKFAERFDKIIVNDRIDTAFEEIKNEVNQFINKE